MQSITSPNLAASKILRENPGEILQTVVGWKLWIWLQFLDWTNIALLLRHSAYKVPNSRTYVSFTPKRMLSYLFRQSEKTFSNMSSSVFDCAISVHIWEKTKAYFVSIFSRVGESVNFHSVWRNFDWLTDSRIHLIIVDGCPTFVCLEIDLCVVTGTWRRTWR